MWQIHHLPCCLGNLRECAGIAATIPVLFLLPVISGAHSQERKSFESAHCGFVFFGKAGELAGVADEDEGRPGKRVAVCFSTEILEEGELGLT